MRHILSSNQIYRQKNCLDLCLQRLIIEECDCYYPRYERLGEARPCLNSTNLECIKREYINFAKVPEIRKKCNEDCPLECDWISYEIQLSNSEYPTREVFKTYKLTDGINKTNLTYYDYKDNFVYLNVFYPYMRYTEIYELPKVTLADLFANIGGSMGIFLGFSVFSIIELLELLLQIIYHALCKRK